jgi:hypothetical protein
MLARRAGGYSKLTMLVPKVARIKVAKTAGKRIQYDSRQLSAALIPIAANTTSAIASDTYRTPSRDGVIVTLTKPNDIASMEAIAATTDRNSRTARLTTEIKRERILAPGMQRKKTAQMMERIVPARAGFSGNVSIRKNATGTQIFADKIVPRIAIGRLIYTYGIKV